MVKIELLAPAKDPATAVAAIDCGADAVYIGATMFGARQAAANTLEQIRKTIEYAHLYYAKVYAAVNTILNDDELVQATRLIEQLYETGIDGLIIQDVGLLELDLPPVPIIASTQMNIDTAEKAEFFASLGLSRGILPRELSLNEISDINHRCDIRLEAFVHGALCVGRSGRCYLSCSMGSRSGNRGQCAQPCRKIYRLEDEYGNVIHHDAYLLSIMDLNRSEYIEQMIDAGVTAFKIEGRLKNIPYVANVTAHYRRLIDDVIRRKNRSNDTGNQFAKASSGAVELNFEPNPERSFNRGFTSYNILGQQEKIGTPATPKSVGQFIGNVSKLTKNCFQLDSNIQLSNADGICFFDKNNQLAGTVINRVEGSKLFPAETTHLYLGCRVFRNSDHKFNQLLSKNPAHRKISIDIELTETPDGLFLKAVDEDGITATAEIPCQKEPARNIDTAKTNIQNNLTKFGNTVFQCRSLTISLERMCFVPAAQLNSLRRQLAENLLQQRSIQRPIENTQIVKNDLPYPQTSLDYTANVLNEKARQFYQRHGVKSIQPAAETGIDLTDKTVMTTRYCIRKQLDICRKPGAEDLYLIDEDGRRFRITFDCSRCGMSIIKE